MYTRIKRSPAVKSSKRKPRLIIAGLVLTLGVAAALLWHVRHTKPNPVVIFHPPQSSTRNSSSKTSAGQGTTINIGPSEVQSSPSPKGAPTDQGVSSSSTSSIATPAGNFVNIHNATVNTQMFSNCTTTVGATCTITFTSASGITKSLPATTTDSGGAVYWEWTPKQLGMESSSMWKITAKANLNGQTKSAIDPEDLEIR